MLLNNGAKPEIQNISIKQTCLHAAVKSGDELSVRYITQKCPLILNTRIFCLFKKNQIYILILKLKLIQPKEDSKGNTALQIAVNLGYTLIVNTLVLNGANIHTQNFLGVSPIDVAKKKSFRLKKTLVSSFLFNFQFKKIYVQK